MEAYLHGLGSGGSSQNCSMRRYNRGRTHVAVFEAVVPTRVDC